jgi:hypothetical protein
MARIVSAQRCFSVDNPANQWQHLNTRNLAASVQSGFRMPGARESPVTSLPMIGQGGIHGLRARRSSGIAPSGKHVFLIQTAETIAITVAYLVTHIRSSPQLSRWARKEP